MRECQVELQLGLYNMLLLTKWVIYLSCHGRTVQLILTELAFLIFFILASILLILVLVFAVC